MDLETHLQSACCDLVAEVVRDSGSANLKVKGLSMLPAIWPGDVLTIRRQTLDRLEPGQIALFHREGRLTAHRVVRIEADSLVTRGDCVPCVDRPVRASEVVGQVEAIRRNGRAIEVHQSPWQRAAAWVLRRSGFCTRLLLHLYPAR